MTTTYASYRLITQNMTKSLAQVAAKTDVKRETDYYLSKIGSVKSVDDFMADSRLYNYALKAHGLEDMAYAKAFVRKVLTEGIDSKDDFANKLSDSRYSDLIKSLNFASLGKAATAAEAAQKGVVDKYMRQTLEEDAGGDNTGVRLALYFQRQAPSITSPMAILADDAMSKVVRTALQIPDEAMAGDIDKLAAQIGKQVNVKDFQDPKKLGKFLERFAALWELSNPSENYNPVSVLGSGSGYGISTDLLLSINNLKLGGR